MQSSPLQTCAKYSLHHCKYVPIQSSLQTRAFTAVIAASAHVQPSSLQTGMYNLHRCKQACTAFIAANVHVQPSSLQTCTYSRHRCKRKCAVVIAANMHVQPSLLQTYMYKHVHTRAANTCIYSLRRCKQCRERHLHLTGKHTHTM